VFWEVMAVLHDSQGVVLVVVMGSGQVLSRGGRPTRWRWYSFPPRVLCLVALRLWRGLGWLQESDV